MLSLLSDDGRSLVGCCYGREERDRAESWSVAVLLVFGRRRREGRRVSSSEYSPYQGFPKERASL